MRYGKRSSLRKGTGQIDVEIHPKKRMPTVYMRDFPMIFHVRCIVAKSGQQSVFGCSLFGGTCFPEIVGRPC
jgi:hypothetical protein